MNQWQMLDHFCKISKKYITEINESDLGYNLLKYQIDNSGPCCSDHQLLNAFKDVTNLDDSKLYELIEKICSEYVYTLKNIK